MSRIIWEIDFKVSGDVTISKNTIMLNQEKGFSIDQFYSTIQVKKDTMGFNVLLTAYAENESDAYTVAYVYLERAINFLSLLIDQPLKIIDESAGNSLSHSQIRRQVTRKNFQDAFALSRLFEQEYPEVTRALSWYCKGNNSFNVLDRFTAYWTCIEVLANKYHTQTERTNSGIINKTYQSYIDYLGNDYVNSKWIDNIYGLRNIIVHGGLDINYEKIIQIRDDVTNIREHAKELLLKIIKACEDK